MHNTVPVLIWKLLLREAIRSYRYSFWLVPALILLLSASHVCAQTAGADTLYLEGGGVLYGDVTNYPPEEWVNFRGKDDVLIRFQIKSVNAIYPAPEKRLGHAPYTPSPAIATAASVLLPGLGMIISGHLRGYVYLGAGAMSVALGASSSKLGGKIIGFGALLTIWAISILDTPFAVAPIRDDVKRVYPYRFQTLDPVQHPQGHTLAPETTSLSFSYPIP